MIKKINEIQLEKKLAKDYPLWAEEAHKQYARDVIMQMDDRLENALSGYVLNDLEENYKHNEFSIYEIRRLRKCKYFEALLLLDKYIKDPVLGRSFILRRR